MLPKKAEELLQEIRFFALFFWLFGMVAKCSQHCFDWKKCCSLQYMEILNRELWSKTSSSEFQTLITGSKMNSGHMNWQTTSWISMDTLHGTKISHLEKRKIIDSKVPAIVGDMLVSWRVSCKSHREIHSSSECHPQQGQWRACRRNTRKVTQEATAPIPWSCNHFQGNFS